MLIFQMEEVNQQVHSSGQEIQSSNQQISELRREYQSLEIELQSQISMVRKGILFTCDTVCMWDELQPASIHARRMR